MSHLQTAAMALTTTLITQWAVSQDSCNNRHNNYYKAFINSYKCWYHVKLEYILQQLNSKIKTEFLSRAQLLSKLIKISSLKCYKS